MKQDELSTLLTELWELGRCRVTKIALTPKSRLELTTDCLGYPRLAEQAEREGWAEKGTGAAVTAFWHPSVHESVPIVLSDHDHITVEVPL